MVRIFWIALFSIAWQITAKLGVFDSSIFPSVDMILRALYVSILDGEIIHETLFSFLLIGKGLSIGLFIAIIVAALCMVSNTINGLVETLTAISHPLPGIALLPLIILWLGTGTNAIIFIIVHSVLWPMILNILAGFRSIPKIYKEVGENFGLGSLQNVCYIMIPASLPYLLAGIKIGWARAWRALISAEMLFGAAGGKGGLGWYIFQRRVFMDTVGIYAGLIVIIFIGILVEDLIFNKIENMTVKKWGMTI